MTKRLNEYFRGFKTCADPVLDGMLVEAMGWVAACMTKQTPRWLSFTGESGTGKTFLAAMALNASKDAPGMMDHKTLSCPVIKTYWPTLLNKLRDGQYHLATDLIAANVVFLDELAIEHDPSGFGADKLCHILSGRVGKWTLITSNLTLRQIATLDGRISSRMIRGGSVVKQCNTQDYAMRGI